MDGRLKRSEMNEFSNENALVWTWPKAQFKRPTCHLMRKIYCSHALIYVRFDTFDATFEPGIANNLTAMILSIYELVKRLHYS